MRLGWLSPADDTPLAVSGETDGPGDDALIEFGERHPALEVQAKHGLTAGAKLGEVIDRIRINSVPGDQTRIVLAVDRGSSRKIYNDFASDLERLRAGRRDGLKAEATHLLNKLEGDASILQRLFVVPIDIDRARDPEAKTALQLLSSVLDDREQAVAALGVLVTDAGDVCARRHRRTRKELVDLLDGAKIKVRPPAKDDRWHRQLDFCRQILDRNDRHHAAVALTILTRLAIELEREQVEARVRYRLAQQRAIALLQLDRYEDALQSARLALDVDATGSQALVIAAKAAVLVGKVEIAKDYVNRAVHAHPQDPMVWGAKAQIDATVGDPLPTPVAAITTSSHYRTVLAQIASGEGDWTRVLTLTAALLADGERVPEVLFLRANALLSMSASNDAIENYRRYDDAERLADELVKVCADDSHPLSHKGLILRASARRLLGRAEDADADLALARELATDDPDTIRHAAWAKIKGGDDDAALELLRHPIVEEEPVLLTMRAELLARRDDDAAARRDLSMALSNLEGEHYPDRIRFAIADVAFLLHDVDFVERVIAGFTPNAVSDTHYLVLQARLAFARGKVEDGVSLYRQAAEQSIELRADCLVELGLRLHKVGKLAEAVQVFDEAGPTKLPSGALRVYATALMQINDLVRAQALVDSLADKGPLPDWALSLASNIAFRQEDADAAIKHLTALIQREQTANHPRIVLTRALLECGRSEDARPHLDALIAEPTLSPIERMEVAHLLHSAGRYDEALPLAFRAFRDAPQDPRLHRALVGITLKSEGLSKATLEVGPDTHVRLKGQDGQTRAHTIYATPPIDPLRGEMSLDDARAADLIGKKAGDIIVHHKGSWQEERWVVESVVPAMLHAAQDAMSHFAERFPQEPFFMQKFSIGDTNSVKAFAPFIASLHARKARVEQIFKLYQEQMLPLGAVAELLGGSIAGVMEETIAAPQKLGPLMVEWPNRERQEESRAAAFDAREVVLTRSALKTASELGLLERLASSYTLVAPRSLVDEIREEVLEAEQLVAKGKKVAVSADTGFQFHELEPDHPLLVEQLNTARMLLDWLRASARIDPRPLPTIGPFGSPEEQVREHIGSSSADAVALVQHLDTTMYADDLGLRRFFSKDTRGRTFSSVGLLRALAERGSLSREERDRHLLTLVTRHYTAVPPSRELLYEALRLMPELGHANVERVFALLGGPGVIPGDAARLVAQVIKLIVTAPIQIVSLERVVEFALEGMSTQWSALLCSRLVARAAADELILLPQQLQIVRQACADYAR
jgi:tetratricopeptide (TPR) repeat protein